jgi:hypothetical protein
MKESPRYAELSKEELKQIESEFGHPLSRELALWFIRNRMNRDAVERMLGARESSGIHLLPDQQEPGQRTIEGTTITQQVPDRQMTRGIKRAKRKTRVLPRKKCA